MLVSLLRRVRGGSHLPQDAQPKRGGAGFAFGQLSRSRNPFQSHFLPKQNVPFLLWNCSEWSFLSLPRRKQSMSKKEKKKNHSNEKESDGERQTWDEACWGWGVSGER